jgi:hypothetical protein
MLEQFAFIVAWILSALLMACGLLVAVFNWLAMTGNFPQQKDGHNVSPIPLIGGLITAIGFMISPSSTIRVLFLLLLVVDPMCLIALLLSAIYEILRIFKK